MKKRYGICRLTAVVVTTFFTTYSPVTAADRVVVVPLGGTVGNATAADVLMGKTFSSKAAGKGVAGTLEIRDGSTIYTNSIGMKFSLIPAGSFVMGSPAGTGDAAHYPFWLAEDGRTIYEKQHVVILTKPFYMETTEVTQAQWEQVMGSGTNPSYFTACGMDCPVEQVSWYDAQNFIDALNASEGRSSCNTTPNTCYFLPTESQWEYAVRAGTLTAFYSGDITPTTSFCIPLDPNLDMIGWYCGNATHPVAQKKPNTWGLYDMSGNVWEWCQDWEGEYPDDLSIDPSGAASGWRRVNRGGDWSGSAKNTRSATRSQKPPGDSSVTLGFRLVLSPGE